MKLNDVSSGMNYRIAISAIFLSLIIITLGCSHKKPFIRPDQATDNLLSLSEEPMIQRLIFIGDAGNALPGDPVMETPHPTVQSRPVLPPAAGLIARPALDRVRAGVVARVAPPRSGPERSAGEGKR